MTHKVKINIVWRRQTHFCPFWYLAATQDVLVLLQWLFSVPLPTHASKHNAKVMLSMAICLTAGVPYHLSLGCSIFLYPQIPHSTGTRPPHSWKLLPLTEQMGQSWQASTKKKTKKKPPHHLFTEAARLQIQKQTLTSCGFEHTPEMPVKHSVIPKLFVL